MDKRSIKEKKTDVQYNKNTPAGMLHHQAVMHIVNH